MSYFKIYLPSSSKAMANIEKRGEDRNTKFWISQEWKSFLDETKKIFHNYLRAIILWKNEK